MPFKVIIAGSRSFKDYQTLEQKCDKILNSIEDEIWIISGTATGTDQLGEKYAQKRGYYLLECPARWQDISGKPSSQIGTTSAGSPYWKLAGHERNREMAEIADALIAFNRGATGSGGTNNMIQESKKRGLLVREIKIR